MSRVSFWLAAAVAALALFVPAGSETLLMLIVLAACAVAFGLWRAALARQRRTHAAPTLVTEPTVLTEAHLQDIAALLVCRANAATSFEAALHAAASVLRSELGARDTTVLEVHGVDATHASVSELIETQPGFKTVARRIRYGGPPGDTPLGRALHSQRAAGHAPGDVAVPVLRDGRVVAAIELRGIEVPVERDALVGLLERARSTLSSLAQARVPPPAEMAPTPHASVLVVHDNEVPPEPTLRILRRLGCCVTVASGMLDGAHALGKTQFDLILIEMPMSGLDAAAGLNGWRRNVDGSAGNISAGDAAVIALAAPGLPEDGVRFCELGFDDHLFTPLCQDRMLAMLSKYARPQGPAESTGSTAAGRVDASVPPFDAAQPVLDPAALARLSELDPTGTSHLVVRVLSAFQTSVARLRPQAETARTSGDRAVLRLVAHTLKSSSASIGAVRLSQLCAQIETTIRLESEVGLAGQLDAMSAALDATLQAVAQQLRERA